jgi:hypothetical protein
MLTVGVAGLIQSGGFLSFSKAQVAGSLLKPDCTANGAVRVLPVYNPTLFRGLKVAVVGFGVGRVTQTRNPGDFQRVPARQATSDVTFRRD